MILMPRNIKYLKQQKGKMVNKVNSYLNVSILKSGSFYLRSLEFGKITAKQLETFYQSLNKYIKKTGKIILKVFPQTSLSKKPIEVRMGKGKGNVALWVTKIKAGTIICEIVSNYKSLTLKALFYAKQKLPLKTKICNY
jgi:large subunit ribosomal protein L16